MRRKLYIGWLALSLLLLLITVVVSVQGTAGTEASLFCSPWIVFLFVAYVAIQILCLLSFRTKLNLHGIGFYLVHTGLVVFLAGCFIYYISGEKIPVNLNVDETAMYNQIQRFSETGNGEFVKMPFDMGLSNFRVEKYEDGSDKYYEATLMISPEGTREIIYEPLIVNKPHRESGWKIYLMGYDGTMGSTVSLLMKWDPGEYVSLSGIIMIIIGCIILCLFRKYEGGEKNAG